MDFSDSLNVEYVREKAQRALDDHSRRTGVDVPERLRRFYGGPFVKYHLRVVAASVPGWGQGNFQLALTPPTWLKKDVGSRETRATAARLFLPIFVTDQDLYVVVDLQSPVCGVGWYQEGGIQSQRNETMDGVLAASPSLDGFLGGLHAPERGKRTRWFRPASLDQDEEWDVDFDV